MSKVGYGNPPLHTRFKPGQSGNPSGRPRGSKNTSTLIMDLVISSQDSPELLLDENYAKKALIRKPRHWKHLPERNLANALITETILKAINGNVRAANVIFKAFDGSEVTPLDLTLRHQRSYTSYRE